MKINESIKNTVGLGVDKSTTEKVSASKVETNAKQQADKAGTAAKSSENVTLSPMAAKLQSLEAKISTTSVFDAEKVDSIKSAIASGQFKVNSEKVADGLIETVKDLLTNRTA